MAQVLVNSPSLAAEVPARSPASVPARGGALLWAVVLVPVAVFLGVDAVSSSGPYPAIAALLGIVLLSGLGYTALRGFSFRDENPALLLVAPATGLVIASAASYLAASYGVDPGFVFLAILCLALPGFWMAPKVVARYWRARISYGLAIVAMLVAIALVYFLPISLRDGIRTPDGGYQWIYVDSAYHQSMVSMVLTRIHPVPDPGFAQESLAYHFGPNALAAAFATTFRLSTADAWVRVMRFTGLFSLVAAVIGFAVWTAPRGSKPGMTVLLALFFVFFACSAIEFAAARWDSSGHTVTQPSKWRLELGDLFYADIYKDTLFYGSGLWAQVVLFTVAGLLIHNHEQRSGNPGVEFLLAPLGVSSNSLAGVSAVGVLAATYLLLGRKSWRNWLVATGSLALCYLMLTAGSFAHGVTSFISGFTTRPDFATKMLDVLIWFAFVFSAFKVVAFLSTFDRRRIIFLSLALFTLGWIAFYLAFHLDWNGEAYALLFLTSLVSGYAAGPATALWLRISGSESGLDAPEIPRAFSGLTKLSMVGLGWGALTLALVMVLVPSRFRVAVVLTIMVMLALVAGILVALRNRPRAAWPAKRLVAALTVLLLMSALGAGRIAWDLGWNGMGTTITLDAGRVRSLQFLHDHSPQDALVATTHHAFPEIPNRPERSYAYAGLSGRRMLLEGWIYREYYAPGFEQVKQDNDKLFATSDPRTAEQIADRYNVGYILTEPSQPLHFDPSTAAWLRSVPNPGTLGIWQVIPHASGIARTQ